MKASADRLRRGLVAAAFLGVAGIAAAFTFIRNSNTNLPVKWPAGAIPFRIMLGTTENLADGTSFNTTADAAARQWNAILGNTQIDTTLTTGTPSQANRVNEMAFAADVYGSAFEPNVVAVATDRRSGNERVEADILFNSARVWNSFRGSRPAGLDPNAIDLRRVALHELGHALGLGHPDEDNQTVFAVMNSRVSSIDTLTEDDIAGAQTLYGPPGVPENNLFANAFPLTLPSGGTSVTVLGHNTNATKETGEPSHAGNAGGSSVWWRWTAPSSGRVDLHTRNSVFDTTLAVYTGSSVSALTAVASDDDIQDGVIQASELTFSAVGGTTYRIAVDGFDRDTGGISLTLNFESFGGSAPTISTHPANATVSTGGSATFSVTAAGTEPLAYQWFFNDVAISGATGASLVISGAQAANSGAYHVVVSNTAGSVTSATATLTVNAAPAPPPASSSGGGGGGGSPSAWFLAALTVLALARRFLRPSSAA